MNCPSSQTVPPVATTTILSFRRGNRSYDLGRRMPNRAAVRCLLHHHGLRQPGRRREQLRTCFWIRSFSPPPLRSSAASRSSRRAFSTEASHDRAQLRPSHLDQHRVARGSSRPSMPQAARPFRTSRCMAVVSGRRGRVGDIRAAVEILLIEPDRPFGTSSSSDAVNRVSALREATV